MPCKCESAKYDSNAETRDPRRRLAACLRNFGTVNLMRWRDGFLGALSRGNAGNLGLLRLEWVYVFFFGHKISSVATLRMA